MSSPSLCEKRMNVGSDLNATATYGSKGWVLSNRARNCFTRRVWFLNAMTVRHCAQLTLSHGIQIKNYNCNNNLRIENMNIDKQKGTVLLSRMQRYISNRFHVSKFRNVLLLVQKIDDIISSANTLANQNISNHSQDRVWASHD